MHDPDTNPLRDSEGKLAIRLPHTNFMKNSFSYSGAVLWNTLPVELRQASSLRTFRSGCKNCSQLFIPNIINLDSYGTHEKQICF
jgi:hypothetical protein